MNEAKTECLAHVSIKMNEDCYHRIGIEKIRFLGLGLISVLLLPLTLIHGKLRCQSSPADRLKAIDNHEAKGGR